MVLEGPGSQESGRAPLPPAPQPSRPLGYRNFPQFCGFAVDFSCCNHCLIPGINSTYVSCELSCTLTMIVWVEQFVNPLRPRCRGGLWFVRAARIAQELFVRSFLIFLIFFWRIFFFFFLIFLCFFFLPRYANANRS